MNPFTSFEMCSVPKPPVSPLNKKMLCCVADETCTFCDIKAVIGSRLVTETDDLLAFKDRSPSAQVHLLIIPRNHIRTVKNLDGGDVVLLEKMIVLGKELLRQQGFNPDDTTQVRLGFHVPPFNSVNHLHMHVIGLPFKNKYRSFKYRQGYPWYADAKKVLDRLSEGMSPI